MSSPYSLDRIATDLTLVYGAESYIRRRGGQDPADPEGRACLAAVIDMVLNSSDVFLTLPGTGQGGDSQLVPRLREYATTVPNSAVALREEVEVEIARGFLAFARARGWSWFHRWVSFQLRDPIVVSGHAVRLQGEWITGDGRNAWKTYMASAGEALPGWSNLMPVSSLPDAVLAHKRDLSDWEFPLCYAFDVYRRGWQYAESVRALGRGAAYLPHALRQNALESGTQAWAEVELVQRHLWSWGHYLCNVLDDEDLPAYESVEAIMDLVDRIKNAMLRNGCPRWSEAGYIDDSGAVVDRKYLAILQGWIVETAKAASVPILRRALGPGEELAQTLSGESVGEAIELAEDAVGGAILLPLKLLRVAVRVLSPELVARVDTQMEQRTRAMKALFFRASYDYKDLVPSME